MKKYLGTLLIIIVLPNFIGSPLQAGTKKFLAQAYSASGIEDKQLLKPILILFREYCIYQKELARYLYIPEDKKQEIAQKIKQKQCEIDAFFTAQKNNTCFINRMIQGMKTFEIYLLNEKLKIIDEVLEEINKNH